MLSLSALFNKSKPLKNQILHRYTQSSTYVDVYQTWKRDSYLESIQHIHYSPILKPIISLKTHIAKSPNGCIPISDVSKRGFDFGLNPNIKVAGFLRMYPSVFEEFTGSSYNLPWFKLTDDAVRVDDEERFVFERCRGELVDRLRKFVLMSKGKVLPLRVVKGMLWYLGLPDDFLEHPDDGFFRVVDIEDGVKGLEVVGQDGETVVSVLERNVGGIEGGIGFPLFPSKGVRLRKKIEDWLKEFQNLPYVSPYDDYSGLDPCSDVAEKRVVGFLHELLCLFVEHSVERKELFCLKKYMGLPQKMHKAFERHPHIFYLSFRNKTCTAILKEAYRTKGAIPEHPMLGVRKRYIELVKKSDVILRNKRMNNRPVDQEGLKNMDLDLDSAGDDWKEIPRCS